MTLSRVVHRWNCLPLALLALFVPMGCTSQTSVAPQGAGTGPATGAATTAGTTPAVASQNNEGEESDSCDELLKSLFDIYRIDKFETTFDISIGANRMNDWYRGCGSRAGAPASPGLPEGARDLFSGAQQALMTGDQYRPRDASHLRDCVLLSTVANRLLKSPLTAGQSELDRAIASFDHVVANIQLQNRHDADLPFTLYEIYLLGKGTAADRAWLFVNTLRALRIDAVLLTAPESEDPGISSEPVPFLVGVPIEGEVYLFDPLLGIPVPGPDSQGAVLRPATLKQVQTQPELLGNLGSAEKPYPLTATQLTKPGALFVGDLTYFSATARVLQQVFAGEHSVLVSDPLEDIDNIPGLWSRLATAGQQMWDVGALKFWKYPQEQVTRSLALDDSSRDVRKGLKLRFMAYLVATPIPSMPGKFLVTGSKESRDPALQGLDNRDAGVGSFSRTESRSTSGRQMEARLAQLSGKLPEALRAYVEVQSNSREILQIPDGNLAMDQRLGPINVKRFHALAIDDAVYWSGLCQLEQGQYGPAVSTFDRYLRQAGRVSEWVRQARRMKGVALAAQGKFEEAAKAVEGVPDEDPEAPGLNALAKAWRAAAGS